MGEISNLVRAEFEGIGETGFPLSIFPQKIQTLVMDLKRYRSYPVEYTALAMISAVATAIGNTYHLHVMDGWNSRAVFYFVILGFPGTCKSHPVNFAFKPLGKLDLDNYKKFREQDAIYKEQQSAGKKNKDGDGASDMEMPICKRTILGNVTPEALVKAHDFNRKGVVLKVDEFLGMIKSADQYSRGQFMENLLSTWSSVMLSVDRCNNPFPTIISNPHINIIGTMQPGVMSEFITEARIRNGFIDRCIFVYPLEADFTTWNLEQPEKSISDYRLPAVRWDEIMQKFISIDYDDSDGNGSTVLEFTDERRTYIYDWRNRKQQEIPKDLEHEREMGRFFKVSDYATRFCLVFQLIRWACGECSKDAVDIVSVKAAIELIDWIDESYHHTLSELTATEPATLTMSTKILETLPDVFETKNAKDAAIKCGMKERTVGNWLLRLAKDHIS